MEHKKRILSLDLAKFIAITLVCVAHCLPLTDLAKDCFLHRFINCFLMPLFFIISGFFADKSFRQPALDFFKKKSLQLIVPTISFTVLELCCIAMWATNKSTAIISECMGSMWFLRCLFLIYAISFLAFYYVEQIYTSHHKLLCEILTAIGVCALLFIIPFGTHHRVNFFMTFFLTGFFIKKLHPYYKKYNGTITLISLFSFISIGMIDAAPIMTFDKIIEEPSLFIKYYVSGLSGALLFIGICSYLCQIFDPSKVLTWMYKVGGCTLGIYGIQSVLLEKILGHYLHISSSNDTLVQFIIVPCLGTIVCIISYYIAIFMSKYKFTRICFLGRK